MSNISLRFLAPKKIDSLTGLRFIAAYMVVLSHIFSGESYALNEMGGVSVQLFFILSGFVMYLNYADRIKIQHISFKKFMLLRIFRLYPVYFLSITLYLIILALKAHSFSQLEEFYIVNLLMLQTWFGNMVFAFNPLNAPSWSVSDEMFFYLSFFILVYFFPSRKIFLGFICYTAIWVILICVLKNKPEISLKWLFYINPLYRLCDFFIGYFVGCLYLHNHKLLNKIWLNTTLEVLGLIILFGSQFIIPMDIYWWSALITSIVAALVIYVYASNKGLFSKLLSTKVMVFLGETSYSLYLIHYLVLFLIIEPFITPLFNSSFLGKLLVIALQLTLPVVAAIIIYKWYEFPLYQYLKRKQRSIDADKTTILQSVL